MTAFKVVAVLAALAVVSFAQHHYVQVPVHIPLQQEQQHHEVQLEEHHHAHPKYEFKYGVRDEHTHDIKEHHEKRDGDKVEGYYKLLEPDGTTRIVHYTADKHSGFHAQVQKHGHAIHPAHHGHQ